LQEYGTHDEPLKSFVLRPEPISQLLALRAGIGEEMPGGLYQPAAIAIKRWQAG